MVFQLAAQAGVRASWGDRFETYLHDNVPGTQRLLEAAKQRGAAGKIIYSSSSSVHGQTHEMPMREQSPTAPYSPYEVTKLSGEHLCDLYRHPVSRGDHVAERVPLRRPGAAGVEAEAEEHGLHGLVNRVRSAVRCRERVAEAGASDGDDPSGMNGHARAFIAGSPRRGSPRERCAGNRR